MNEKLFYLLLMAIAVLVVSRYAKKVLARLERKNKCDRVDEFKGVYFTPKYFSSRLNAWCGHFLDEVPKRGYVSGLAESALTPDKAVFVYIHEFDKQAGIWKLSLNIVDLILETKLSLFTVKYFDKTLNAWLGCFQQGPCKTGCIVNLKKTDVKPNDYIFVATDDGETYDEHCMVTAQKAQSEKADFRVFVVGKTSIGWQGAYINQRGVIISTFIKGDNLDTLKVGDCVPAELQSNGFVKIL